MAVLSKASFGFFSLQIRVYFQNPRHFYTPEKYIKFIPLDVQALRASDFLR